MASLPAVTKRCSRRNNASCVFWYDEVPNSTVQIEVFDLCTMSANLAPGNSQCIPNAIEEKGNKVIPKHIAEKARYHHSVDVKKRGAFIQRRFYKETLLHTDSFTNRRFYTQTLLHTDHFTHRRF